MRNISVLSCMHCCRLQIRRGASLLRATHQLEVLAQLQSGSRRFATTRGSRYSGDQEASATVQLAHALAPDHDAAVLEFALATSLHHDGITGVVWCSYGILQACALQLCKAITALLACPVLFVAPF
jgi:hypothetical protein